MLWYESASYTLGDAEFSEETEELKPDTEADAKDVDVENVVDFEGWKPKSEELNKGSEQEVLDDSFRVFSEEEEECEYDLTDEQADVVLANAVECAVNFLT